MSWFAVVVRDFFIVISFSPFFIFPPVVCVTINIPMIYFSGESDGMYNIK